MLMSTRLLRKMMRSSHQLGAAICLCLVIFVVIQLRQQQTSFGSISDDMSNLQVKMELSDESSQVNPSACPVPHFPVIIDPPQVVTKLKQATRHCATDYERDWVTVEPGTARISFNEAAVGAPIMCDARAIMWVDDFNSRLGPLVRLTPGQIAPATFFQVNCTAATTQAHSLRRHHTMYHVGIRRDANLLKRLRSGSGNGSGIPATANRFDILILGIDSLSRLAWQRHLPDSYAYFTRQMRGHVYNKCNTLGDGTTVNLFGLLTGRKEWELPESRRSHGDKAVHIDKFGWIWRYAARGVAGVSGEAPDKYATMYVDDDVKFGAFEYRLKGFSGRGGAPTDVYGRQFFLHADKAQLRYKHKACFGGRPRFRVLSDDFCRAFWTAYSDVPKWTYVFSALLSHDDNEPSKALDDDIKRFLTDVHTNPIYNQTVLILMSDHGHRFTSRLTMRGKYEERLPFLGFRVPDAFRAAYPQFTANLESKHNRNQLVTHLDAFETQMEMIRLPVSPRPSKKPLHDQQQQQQKQLGIFNYRQQSLLRRLPHNRTCANIGLEPHWCSCLHWRVLPVTHPLAVEAANQIVLTINRKLLIGPITRQKCYWPLRTHRVISAGLVSVSDKVARFVKSKDTDGRVPEFSSSSGDRGAAGGNHQKKRSTVVQVTLETRPGNAMFEASVTFLEKQKTASHTKQNLTSVALDGSQIQRINKYADWVTCLTMEEAQLRKFCLCKSRYK